MFDISEKGNVHMRGQNTKTLENKGLMFQRVSLFNVVPTPTRSTATHS
jgi:hypothetical protein